MTKREFSGKYDGAIRAMAVANNMDMAVGRDMLIYEARCSAGDIKREDTYKGVPEGLDLAAVYADYKAIAD